MLTRRCLLALLLAFSVVDVAAAQSSPDSLPSWNGGVVKKSIVDFVAAVTTQGGAEFVPAGATNRHFDNDGTLWTEQPFYFQGFFAVRPRQGDGPAASGMEDDANVQGAARQEI